MKLRQGRTRKIIESSMDSALLAVEIYNKPRTAFRREGYISLMIIAWTKLFHAYFNHLFGDKYYFKRDNGRYDIVDGEKKAWDLVKCIKEFQKNEDIKFSSAVEANLLFFVGLRNKIEHRHISESEIDKVLFGEYQSFLYNYENLLVSLFGEEYSINDNLSYSIQFSKIRTDSQILSNKEILSKDVIEINDYISKYRLSLSDDIYQSQEYSIKLLLIPKISNTDRGDLAFEFVKWNEIGEEDKESYKKINAIVKDKVLRQEAVNVGKYRVSDVLRKVNSLISLDLNSYDHKCLYYIFSIRPIVGESSDPFNTNTNYCLYDEVHRDYIYNDKWVNLIVDLFNKHSFSKEQIKQMFSKKKKIDVEEYQYNIIYNK